MAVATKIEACLFTLLFLFCVGCGVAERAPKKLDRKQVIWRDLACKRKGESDSTLADCVCNSPTFVFNAKTGEEEIQCAGEVK